MNMRIMTIILSLFLTIISFSAHAENGDSLAIKIDEYMSRAEKNGFSGALLVSKDGEIVLSKGYGLADREKNIPITKHSVFTIGSITKQFTGAAILKLQMQGKLKVDDPIKKYFNDVPDDKKGITLHHLLTHSAGFSGAIGGDFQPINQDEFIDLAMKTTLNHKPGELYEYSNVGYSLLGAIIEIVTGQTYEKFLHQNLFKPAGISKTGYRIPEWRDEELAHGYRGNKDWGTLIDKPWAEDGPYWHLHANGGILSTVEDMYKWHLALQGDKILSEKAKQLYYTPHVREGENAESFYGYGWAIFTTPHNTKLVAHNGGNTIFSADFLRYVDEDVVVIAMANTSGQPAWKVSNTIARIVFGHEYKLPPEKIETISEKQLKKLEIGQRALALLEIYKTDDEQQTRAFIQQNFEPKYLKQVTEDKLVRFIQQDQKGIGEARIDRIVKTGDHSLEITVQSQRTGEWWQISLEVESESPYRITQIGVVDTVHPEDIDSESGGDDLNAKWGLPQSNTGKRSAALLEAINRVDQDYVKEFIKTNFSPDFLSAFSMGEHLNQFKTMHQEIGELELLDAMKTGPNSAQLKVRSTESNKIFKIMLTLEDAAPFKISGLVIEIDK